MHPRPLQAPPPEPSRLRRFLFAPWKRIHRCIREQLLERDASVLDAWVPEDRPLATFITHAAAELCEWPNAHFLPEDPFYLVAWHARDPLSVMELAIAIEAHVGRKFDKSFWDPLASQETRLVEVVRAVREACDRNEGKPWKQVRFLDLFLRRARNR